MVGWKVISAKPFIKANIRVVLGATSAVSKPKRTTSPNEFVHLSERRNQILFARNIDPHFRSKALENSTSGSGFCSKDDSN
jgi:hypothetical protein